LEVLNNNKHYSYPQNLFEIDDVILLDSSTRVGARTERHLSVVLCHSKANFSEIKAIMENIFDVLGIDPDIEEKGLDCFIEGRRCTATFGGKTLCWAGEIKPKVIFNWGLELPIAALEMDVDFLLNLV
jgi:phenylalanyl-tRNA synthetase beta chain